MRIAHGIAASSLVLLAACSGGGAADTGGGGSTSMGGAGGGEPVAGRPPGVALCYTPLADEHPATAAFWAAFSAGDRDARADVITGLEAAVMEHPAEEELALLLGLAHLWRVAEPLDGETGDQGIMVQSALAAKGNLETAYTLCPTDHRIPAWLGVILVNMGRALASQTTIDAGLAMLQTGIDHYPSFVLFSKLLVFADQPVSDPEFQKALQAFAENSDACAATPGDPACGDHPRAAHNVEGSSIFVGDVLAKAGRRDEALARYERGKTGPTYTSWPFQGLLDERIAGVDARVAASADTDPGNDPDVAWKSTVQCAVCHTH
ncbi:Hypothetical protein A7982_06379 [Minicystis rosea]|nr:Hypothetical protein A7982_06379 [Minicystis rosea]